MRISDWSSDVCSSDLGPGAVVLRSSGVGTVRGDHAASRILSDADRDRPAQAPRSRSGGASRAAGGGGVRLRLVAKDAAAPGRDGRVRLCANRYFRRVPPRIGAGAGGGDAGRERQERDRVVAGKRGSVRVDLGGGRSTKKKK